jgi:hypothetical protein
MAPGRIIDAVVIVGRERVACGPGCKEKADRRAQEGETGGLGGGYGDAIRNDEASRSGAGGSSAVPMVLINEAREGVSVS